jgi:hypothetical protein
MGHGLAEFEKQELAYGKTPGYKNFYRHSYLIKKDYLFLEQVVT